MTKKRPPGHLVTLRRDVQQVVEVYVEDPSREGAIAAARDAVDEDQWRVETILGAHPPKAVPSFPRRTR